MDVQLRGGVWARGFIDVETVEEGEEVIRKELLVLSVFFLNS